MDIMIVHQGEGEDYEHQKLHAEMNFWLSRYLLLPGCHQAVTSKICSRETPHCDIYDVLDYSNGAMDPQLSKLVEGFVKFMETVNRLRRQQASLRFLSGEKEGIAANLKQSGLSPAQMNLTTALPAAVIAAACGAGTLATAPDTENKSGAATGLTFFPATNKLPDRTFVSAEFIHWLLANISDLKNFEQAMQFAQQQIENGRVCHVSGDRKRPFVYGFYLYYFVGPSVSTPVTVISSMLAPVVVTTPTTPSAPSKESGYLLEAATIWDLCDSNAATNEKISCPFELRTCKTDFDPNKKTERNEWGRIRYCPSYCPSRAFEIDIQWLVATANAVSEMVYGWHRKAPSCGLHLIPAPIDPFALPHNQKSDPLRCPIFVPLKNEEVDLLKEDEFREFQISILRRFGFITMGCRAHDASTIPQFVHVSGGMFVMLPPPTPATERDRGFLWAWNNMLSHKYRSPPLTGDEAYQDKMLADFIAFCNNKENRLVETLHSWKGDTVPEIFTV